MRPFFFLNLGFGLVIEVFPDDVSSLLDQILTHFVSHLFHLDCLLSFDLYHLCFHCSFLSFGLFLYLFMFLFVFKHESVLVNLGSVPVMTPYIS